MITEHLALLKTSARRRELTAQPTLPRAPFRQRTPLGRASATPLCTHPTDSCLGAGSHSPRVRRTDPQADLTRAGAQSSPCSSGDASVSRRRWRWRLLRTGPDKLSLGTRTLCVGRAGTVRGGRLLCYLIPRWRRRRRRRFLFRRCFRRRGCCGWLEWRRPVIRRRRCEVRWRGQMRRRGPIEGLVPVRRRSSVRRRHRRWCTRRVGRRAG